MVPEVDQWCPAVTQKLVKYHDDCHNKQTNQTNISSSISTAVPYTPENNKWVTLLGRLYCRFRTWEIWPRRLTCMNSWDWIKPRLTCVRISFPKPSAKKTKRTTNSKPDEPAYTQFGYIIYQESCLFTILCHYVKLVRIPGWVTPIQPQKKWFVLPCCKALGIERMEYGAVCIML